MGKMGSVIRWGLHGKRDQTWEKHGEHSSKNEAQKGKSVPRVRSGIVRPWRWAA